MSIRESLFGIVGSVLLLTPVCSVAAQVPSGRQQQIETESRLAQQYVDEKKPSLALQEYRSIVALDASDVDARVNLGVLLFFEGQYKDANPQLRAALRLQPNLYKIQALLGMSEKRTGEMSEARSDLETALPKLKDNNIRIQSGLELIDLYYAAQNLAKAAEVAGVLRSLEPTNPHILFTSYQIYSELTNETILATAMVAPHSAEMHQIMAHEMARQGNTAGAIEQYRQALKLNPRLPGLHFELAELLNASSNPALHAQAKAEYEAALAVNRFDEKSECRLGEIAAKAGDLRPASADFSRALQLQPSDSEAMTSQAEVLILLNQRGEAAALLERSLKLDPTSSTAHYRLSRVYQQMGRTADAKRQLEEFLKYKQEKEQLRKLFELMHVQADAHSSIGESDLSPVQ